MALSARARIPVEVHASDPLSFAGATGQLRRQPEVELVEEMAGRPGTVAILLVDALDEATLSRLRRLTRTEGTRVVLVANALREADLLQVVECGVRAIVWRREATEDRLLQAVRAAARGDGDLPSDLIARLITQVGSMQRSAERLPGMPASGLVRREVDVLRLVADGLSTEEVAAKLAYSERTVKNVMHGLTTRLHLRNRAHAVAYALREGYI
ncbi:MULTISPECIES: response regulator transcription factor [Streptomyces]|uniref:Helix-turn-helix transcriptional regulator n=1 Tax=Streptomyces virginiae TaxID=1961 RepID=A0ABQ3NXT4_STRVG|nr:MULTISPECIES: response regulator transcription factor [Streptomyces]KOU82101.1 LuxR family transcriptional regulator [Streptomyces sp. XY593]KOU90177.1 LuxR family transcriptional regulator [Streptomyces sp. XY533]KOV01261.1 LuxR family transcriptional regulator [Streptomyces sp. XY511]KOV39427.1 LuxR family transcriptional regulator [Streptomyces sp. H036]MBP2348771.1 DNA-binding NarL/FixJ family response regulator [Streptomyces virginiae]